MMQDGLVIGFGSHHCSYCGRNQISRVEIAVQSAGSRSMRSLERRRREDEKKRGREEEETPF